MSAHRPAVAVAGRARGLAAVAWIAPAAMMPRTFRVAEARSALARCDLPAGAGTGTPP
ncbi:MAG: hypothetical protein WCP53_05160 [Verrucomicrobiota bacterium]